MNNDSLELLLTPVSDEAPCGSDLEYDPAFTALDAAARPKAEQQFGDSVIPEVPPDWRVVAAQASDLLQRSKDVRVAVLALRASTRLDGIAGFVAGMQALSGLMERFWDGLHPQLDADDDNDPTMRLNALAPLTDGDMVLRDLHEARVGTSRSLGPLTLRDIELALGKLNPREGETVHSSAQVEGALAEIFESFSATKEACSTAADAVTQLQSLINERVSSYQAVDLKPLRDVAYVVQQLAKGMTVDGGEVGTEDGSGESGGTDGSTAVRGARGEITTRQDAINTLDKVIRFLEQTEPGNPAPLLIKRAQRLIGVSFMDIMTDLAPDALSTIETITGRPS